MPGAGGRDGWSNAVGKVALMRAAGSERREWAFCYGKEGGEAALRRM